MIYDTHILLPPHSISCTIETQNLNLKHLIYPHLFCENNGLYDMEKYVSSDGRKRISNFEILVNKRVL